MVNNHVIAYARFTLIIINVKSVKYYLAARKTGMKNGTFTSCAVQYGPTAVLYSTLLNRILRL